MMPSSPDAGRPDTLRGEYVANRANWDERADVHAASRFYDVEGLLAEPGRISDVARRDLDALTPHLPRTGVKGLSLCHLQCHIGADTLSWARLGAVDVHGSDLSGNSLKHARRIAERAGAPITYVECEATRTQHHITRRFDVVVTSVGAICWLPDLLPWGRTVAALLKPGGVFLVREPHPTGMVLNLEDGAGTPDRPWTVAYDYFNREPVVWDDDETYTDGETNFTHTVNYEWDHSFAEVVGALLGAGLVIEGLYEYPDLDWPASQHLVANDNGGWEPPAGGMRIPMTFAVVARKPAD